MNRFQSNSQIKKLVQCFFVFLFPFVNLQKTSSFSFGIALGSSGHAPFEDINNSPSYFGALLKVTTHFESNSNKPAISEIEEGSHFFRGTKIDKEDGILVKINASQYCKKNFGKNPKTFFHPYPNSTKKWLALIDGKLCPELLRNFIKSLDHQSSSVYHPPKATFKPSFQSTSNNFSSASFLSILRNASALLIYNFDFHNDLPPYKDFIFINLPTLRGHSLSRLLDNNTSIHISITIGNVQQFRNYGNTINKTSMLFLSVSFVVLMIISLAWLVFYYVQRSRYTYAKQRLSRRLMRAAKKAISKMPLKTIHSREDVETDIDVCAVCIEGYKTSDIVRELPCRHIFHKPCIDPWLVEQRSCPICKIDILKAFGLQIIQPGLMTLTPSDQHVVVASHNMHTTTSHSSSLMVDMATNDSANESTTREFDSDGVEIVRFHELAQVEHHRRSQISWSSGSGGAAEMYMNGSSGRGVMDTCRNGSCSCDGVSGSCGVGACGDSACGSGVCSGGGVTSGSCAGVAGSLSGVSRVFTGADETVVEEADIGINKRNNKSNNALFYNIGNQNIENVNHKKSDENASSSENIEKIINRTNERCEIYKDSDNNNSENKSYKRNNEKIENNDDEEDDEGDEDDAKNGLLHKFSRNWNMN